MTRPSDRAIAQAFWELAAPEKDGGQTIGIGVQYLITRARQLDATAAPVVVGEDVMAKAWRNLYIDLRMQSIEFEGMPYEMRRAHAEASANDFEDEFRARMAKPMTAALAGD